MTRSPSATFAKRLREARLAAELTQSELARRISGLTGIDIDASSITRVEKHVRLVKLDEAVAAAEVLGIPLTALLGDASGSLDARIRNVEFELAQERSALQTAMQEVERRQRQIAEMEEQLTLLREENRIDAQAEVEREWAEDHDSSRWPG